ncbi:hypothetical protein VKT23_006073 [Stygiomarasmius scandens]|uniref:F-box protein n=1 Tax=Marasmiellus scandens TaxID=2682957 RepID=A0ABR1JTN1_9AGAR
MSAPAATSLQIPTEIIEKVIREHWVLHLSTSERLSFMLASMLVNSTWMALYMRISSVDVHIPSLRYVRKIIEAFGSPVGSDGSSIYHYSGLGCFRDLLRHYCRSITFRRDSQTGTIVTSVYALFLFLSENEFQSIGQGHVALSDPYHKAYLPLLHRISFELVDETLDGVFPLGSDLPSDFRRISGYYAFPFPSQITTFEVSFSYSPDHAIWQNHEEMTQLLLNVDPSGIPCLRSIRILRIYGPASAGALRDLVWACNDGTNSCEYEGDVSLPDLEDRILVGTKMRLEKMSRDSRERDKRWNEDLAREQRSIEKKMKYLLFKATDEEVLESIGDEERNLDWYLYEADGERELRAQLVELKQWLRGMTTYRGERDKPLSLLEMGLVKRQIRVCEQAIQRRLQRVGLVNRAGIENELGSGWAESDDDDGYNTADDGSSELNVPSRHIPVDHI